MAKGLTADKVRNLTEAELLHQEHDLNDQLFRLKFQLKLGQTESLKKIRGLRRDIARIKTIARERVLAGGNGNPAPVTDAPVTEKRPAAAKAAVRPTKKAAVKKTAAGRK
jgi:large subunit ribosomal protein L29